MNKDLNLDLEIGEAIQQLKYIVDQEIWNRNKSDERFLRKLANELIGKDVDPKVHLIGNKTLYKVLIEVNTKFNSQSKSTGANEFRERIIQVQGGEFCALCGDRRINFLHVDHINPIASGGEHHLSNMQLLCVTCNSSKKDNKFNGIESIFRWTNDSQISSSLRYRVLLESIVSISGRMYGSCKCGNSARNSNLNVTRKSTNIAANYGNLFVHCAQCRKS